MPVHPLIAARFPLIADVPSFDAAFGDPDADRKFFAFAAPYGPYALPDVLVQNGTLPGPHGDIGVRVYRPRDTAPSRPGLLWMHGGAFRAGELDMPEAHVVSAELAVRGAIVVSVDYRLATETVHFPVPLDDVMAAWRWFTEKAIDELDTDPGRLAIGGASAGGNLALAASVRARDESLVTPAAVLLAYPVAHFPVPPLTDDLAAEMRPLPRLVRFLPADLLNITSGYVGRLSDIPTGAMPGHGNLEGLPPTRLVLSEYDDLRSSGELLELQLQEARVPVVSMIAEGMLHGHLNITPTDQLPEIERSLDFLAAGLLT